MCISSPKTRRDARATDFAEVGGGGETVDDGDLRCLEAHRPVAEGVPPQHEVDLGTGDTGHGPHHHPSTTKGGWGLEDPLLLPRPTVLFFCRTRSGKKLPKEVTTQTGHNPPPTCMTVHRHAVA